MMPPNPRLELTWIGKETRPRLEPRILIADDEKSHHANARHGKKDVFDNRLIFGDNLLALKALEQEFTGKVKCIYIDPPYNTGSAFEHYDDGIEHSIWLGLMRDRLELLRRLLKSDGSIWISIDDNEQAYLKIMMDELFGRNNFVANVVWQKRTSPDNRLRLGNAHDFIMVYTKTEGTDKDFNQLEVNQNRLSNFKNPDNDPRGPWASTDCTAQAGHATKDQFYVLTTPAGRVIKLPDSLCWRYTEKRMKEEITAGHIWFGKDGKGVPRKKTYLSELEGQNAWSWWTNNEVGHNQEAKKEINMLFGADTPFDTPKPERLIERILTLATNPGDLVLDSFAGSGTTGAVAHKMGRRWIMIELGEHCHTHIIPRLKKVIDGGDPGGITESAHWKGGGGFRYYRLAPSLLEKDKFGNWIINKQYNATQLAEAVCKLEGFTYSPSDSDYWNNGYSNENSFIYVTTQTLNNEYLALLSDEVGKKRKLLVMCSAFKQTAGGYKNLEIKKIPNTVLSKCEWGHDDYSLQIENLPMAKKVQVELFEEEEE